MIGMRLLSAIAGAFLLVVALTADVEADTERRHPRESLFKDLTMTLAFYLIITL